MEILGLLDVPVWLMLIVALVILYFVYMTSKFNTFKKMGVQGPKPIPVFGNLYQAFTKGVIANDIELYEKYDEKIYGTFDGRTPVLNVGQPELIKQIMVKDFSNFVNRRTAFKEIQPKPLTEMLTLIEDAHWKFVRNSITPTFSSKKLKEMTPLINQAADRLIENLNEYAESKQDIDLKRFMSSFTFDVISSTAFGMDVNTFKEEDTSFVKAARYFFNTKAIGIIISILFFFPFFSHFIKYFRKTTQNRIQILTSVMQQAIDERRKNPGVRNDFLDIVLRTEKEKGKEETKESNGVSNGSVEEWNRKYLTEDEIMAQAILFLLAGFETTSNTLMFTMYELALHPECLEKAIQEVDDVIGDGNPTYENVNKLQYIDMCIEETMRMYPAAVRIDRVATHDVTVGDVKLPKGMVVNIPIACLHADPKYWPEPKKYDPERFSPENKPKIVPFTYLPFGQGPRNCIGMRLALLELKFALIRILQKFRPVKSSKTVVPPPLSKLGNLIPADVGLWVQMEKR